MVVPTGPIGLWGMAPNFNWFGPASRIRPGSAPKNTRQGAFGSDPQGITVLEGVAKWSTRTPSAVDKVYVFHGSYVHGLVDGTFFTLTEGVIITKVDYSGSFFEAYSAQRFSVIICPYVIDKDNIGAAAEQALATFSDPKVYTLAKNTNVIGVGTPMVRHSKLIGSGLWYVKIPTGGILNKLVKPFVANQALNYTGATREYPVGMLDFAMITGSTDNVYYNHRTQLRVATAEATPSLLINV